MLQGSTHPPRTRAQGAAPAAGLRALRRWGSPRHRPPPGVHRAWGCLQRLGSEVHSPGRLLPLQAAARDVRGLLWPGGALACCG